MVRNIALLAAAVVLGTVAPASAGVNKTWVSSTGNDAGACPFTAPCRTFDYAIGQTNPKGEIDVKDTGGYGAFTITKPVSILAGDSLATINVAANGQGVTVSAGATDTVVIQGLTVDGHGTGGGTGFAISGGLVHLIGCAARGLDTGIATGGQVVTLDGAVVEGNGFGLKPQSGTLYVSGSWILFNSIGVYSRGGYTFLDNDTLTGNTQYQYDAAYGILYSFGNNTIASGNYGGLNATQKQ